MTYSLSIKYKSGEEIHASAVEIEDTVVLFNMGLKTLWNFTAKPQSLEEVDRWLGKGA